MNRNVGLMTSTVGSNLLQTDVRTETVCFCVDRAFFAMSSGVSGDLVRHRELKKGFAWV